MKLKFDWNPYEPANQDNEKEPRIGYQAFFGDVLNVDVCQEHGANDAVLWYAYIRDTGNGTVISCLFTDEDFGDDHDGAMAEAERAFCEFLDVFRPLFAATATDGNLNNSKYEVAIVDSPAGLCPVLRNRLTKKAVPADEPTFILRAQDARALPAVSSYLIEIHDLDDDALKASAADMMERFVTWQQKNQERISDPD